MISLAEIDSWSRVGGRELQFIATDEDVHRWLSEGLPDEYKPYELIGLDVDQMTKSNHRAMVFAFPTDDFLSSRANASGRSNFWISSRQKNGGLERDNGPWYTKYYSFNGLIQLTHGGMRGDKKEISRIAVVDKVRNLISNEIRESKSSAKIFRALKRRIQRDLIYSSICDFADGSREEDKTLVLMTQCAWEECSAGIKYERLAGHRMK